MGSSISSLANSFISNWYDNSLGYAVCAAWGKVVELWPTLLGSVGKCVDSSGPDGINEARNDAATHKFEGCFWGFFDFNVIFQKIVILFPSKNV